MAQLELKYLSILKLGDFLTCCLAIFFKFNCSIVREERRSRSHGNIGSSESYTTHRPLTAVIETINSYSSVELPTNQEGGTLDGWAF